MTHGLYICVIVMSDERIESCSLDSR